MYQLIFGLPPWFNQASKFQSERIPLEEIIVQERSKPLSFMDVSNTFIGFDEKVKLILTKALNINTQDRFTTAKEFIEMLNKDAAIKNSIEPTPIKSKQNSANYTYPNPKPMGFAAIAGMEELKEQLKLDVIDAIIGATNCPDIIDPAMLRTGRLDKKVYISPLDKLLIRTAFCCMVSDGHIGERETELIKSMCADSYFLKNIDFSAEITLLINELMIKGKDFIAQYFESLENAILSEEQKLIIADFAIQTIKSDDKIEYSEIKFFKNIWHRLKLNGDITDTLMKSLPDIALFFEDDISVDNSLPHITNQYLATFEPPKFNIESKEKNPQEKELAVKSKENKSWIWMLIIFCIPLFIFGAYQVYQNKRQVIRALNLVFNSNYEQEIKEQENTAYVLYKDIADKNKKESIDGDDD